MGDESILDSVVDTAAFSCLWADRSRCDRGKRKGGGLFEMVPHRLNNEAADWTPSSW